MDTTCVIAALCSWHVHHGPVRAEIDRRTGSGEKMVVSAHTLAEAYAVLTRLPAPHRLSPADALSLLEANFSDPTRVIMLDRDAYWRMLRRASSGGIQGGHVYDALIAACAREGKASAILTMNARHFEDFQAPDLDIVTPGEA